MWLTDGKSIAYNQSEAASHSARRKGACMPNIIDYVQWQGDLTLKQVPLSAVDALMLSYLS